MSDFIDKLNSGTNYIIIVNFFTYKILKPVGNLIKW